MPGSSPKVKISGEASVSLIDAREARRRAEQDEQFTCEPYCFVKTRGGKSMGKKLNRQKNVQKKY